MRLYDLIENYLIYAQIELVVHDPSAIETMRNSRTAEPRIVIEDQAIQKAQLYDREGDLNLSVTDVTAVRVVEDYLRKMIAELVDNAFKFSEPGRPVTVEGVQTGDYYQVRITDQGRGMTEEEISHIGAYMQFNRRFYEHQGSGLGLVIARRLAELHEGELIVESEPDQYTTTTVRLPLA
jgi:signal transduction histidine kinase